MSIRPGGVSESVRRTCQTILDKGRGARRPLRSWGMRDVQPIHDDLGVRVGSVALAGVGLGVAAGLEIVARAAVGVVDLRDAVVRDPEVATGRDQWRGERG